MKTIEGDLIGLAKEGEFDVIVHGCNCFCTMDAGIAKLIAKAFPSAVLADGKTEEGDKEKLGTITTAEEMFGMHQLTIVNAYTQFDYKGGGQLVDYDAITSCFERIAEAFGDRRIGYPKIGAGMAGGDWDEIAARIDRALAECDHRLVVLPQKG